MVLITAGSPINVVFAVDANGLLQVEATEEFTGTRSGDYSDPRMA